MDENDHRNSGFTYKKNVIFHSYVNVYQRVKSTCQDLHISEIYRFCRTCIHCPTYKTRSLSAQHLSIWDTLTSHSYAVDHAETLVNIPGPRRPKKRNWSAMHSIRPRKCTDWDQESFPAAIIDGYIMYIYISCIYISCIYIYHVYIYNITLICFSPSSMSSLPDIWRDRLVNVGIFVKPILSTLGAFHVYHWLLISSALCMVILDIPRFLAANKQQSYTYTLYIH